jgi:hypothetical protein
MHETTRGTAHDPQRDTLRPTDDLPAEPDALPSEPEVLEHDDHVLADWKAADPDAFRPAGVDRADDELPLDPEDDDVRRGF